MNPIVTCGMGNVVLNYYSEKDAETFKSELGKMSNICDGMI